MKNVLNEKKRVVALLPMKENSVRVKGKNFRDFCGKPLFRWILDTLHSVEVVDQIIINTDGRHALKEKGLTETDRIVIRDRKPEICGDHVSMNLVLADDIANVSADTYLMTHTTNPLMSVNTINEALSAYHEAREIGAADSLFTVDKVQMRFYRSDCGPINHDPKNLIPTQNLEPWFAENSNLYIFGKDSFRNSNARIGVTPMMFETPQIESVDIDTPDDWERAIIAAQHQQGKKEK